MLFHRDCALIIYIFSLTSGFTHHGYLLNSENTNLKKNECYYDPLGCPPPWSTDGNFVFDSEGGKCLNADSLVSWDCQTVSGVCHMVSISLIYFLILEF